MAQKSKAYAVSALKALTYRIASTPTVQLPRCVAQLSSSIWTCRDVLSTPPDALKQDAELSVVVHRFKTQLSTLLQDRTVEGRWSAIVLVKAAVEAGGVDILSKSHTWLRNLLGILKKPDPPSTRGLAVLTMTRMFMLTWDYPNLVRELTTPTLPTFVSACLNNAESSRCSSEELQGILEAFELLIPYHPTIFRSNDSVLHSFLLRVISSSASEDSHHFSPRHVLTAQRVLVLSSFCAPKQGGAEKWDELLQNAVKAAHQTCDVLFSPVVENWKSNLDAFRDHAAARHVAVQLEQDQIDAVGLRGYSGAFAGAERLLTLLDLIEAHVDTASPTTVAVRLGMILDLASRLLSLTVPGSKQKSLQTNTQMSAITRDELFTVLPAVHERTLHMLETMYLRLGAVMLSTVSTVLEAIMMVFASESFDSQLRAATYSLLRVILQRTGPNLSKDDITDLTQVVVACCNDLLSDPRKRPATTEQLSNKTPGRDLVLQMSKTEPSNPTFQRSLHLQAVALLPVMLSRLDAAKVPRKIRTQMDRTAVLTKHKNALIASVFNPPPSPSGHGLQSSLLPLLARLFPDEPEVEALVRPRMPWIVSKRSKATGQDEEEAEDEDGISIEEENNDEVSPSKLVDHATGTAVTANSEGPEYRNGRRASSEAVASGKRTLADGEDENDSVKKPRHETASSQIQNEWTTALAVADRTTAREATVVESSAPIVSSISSVDWTSARHASEDDSDFEMPPLTMEQDTEDEDEE